MFTFGSGTLWGVSTASGVQTPIKFGTLQEVSVDISFNKKELYGGSQFPVAIARGTGKVACKAKFANINGRIFNDLFFGSNMVTGQLLTANGESATIPATPYTVTVTNGTTFAEDLGVIFTDTGVPLSKVSSAPTTGQYSVATGGVYTFAAADTTKAVAISYTYNDTTSGQKITVTNQLLGTSPFFQAYLTTTYNGEPFTMKLHRCMSSKMTYATKLEDFGIPEMDFDAFADDGGNVLTISSAD